MESQQQFIDSLFPYEAPAITVYEMETDSEILQGDNSATGTGLNPYSDGGGF